MTQQEAETLTRCLIKAMRGAKGHTQEQAARAMGISRPSYSQIENGKRQVMALELVALCDFWGIPYKRMFVGYE